jgi:hypothetical protein
MQTKYELKVQAIRSQKQQARLYVYFPLPLAAAIGLETHPESLFFAISRPRSPLFSMSSFARNGLSG